VAALIELVRVGALKHDEKGRVGAFAARFESNLYGGPRDRPIAADLAAAFTALARDEKQKLLLAILDIDEPLVLAQLIGLVPQEVRARIEARLDALTPADAAAIRSLPEAMGRIEALLTADQADALRNLSRRSADSEPMERPPEGISRNFGSTCNSNCCAGTGAASRKPSRRPNFPDERAKRRWTSSISSRGLAALRNPDGSAEGAVAFFGALHQRHPHVAAYSVNLFAAQISHLLGTDGFTELHGFSLVRGRQILAEAEQAMLHLREVSAQDLELCVISN
jgi:hypothetical protein